MFEHITLDFILLLMLYAVGATVPAVACVYLLLRRGNAFTRHISTPKRLRRWTAVFFGFVALSHLWYLPGVMMADGDAAALWMLIGGLLDCQLTFPAAIIVLLCMLQDHRRPLWPVWVAMSPLIILMTVSVGMRSYAMVPWLRGYLLLLGIFLTVYMVRAVRQYGRWLRDNYADLEHKEVWQSFVVLAVVVLMFGYYVSGDGSMAYEFIVQVCGLVMVVYLLWRVETLQDLTPRASRKRSAKSLRSEGAGESLPSESLPSEGLSFEGLSEAAIQEIGKLLHERCEASKLYLQHDLTVTQLAQALGTNRYYLSQYFAHEGTTYNAYINTLRIAHFQALYTEAKSSDAGLSISAKQLANLSGYRSYSTFSLAFKQRTGQSVTTWITAQELRSPIK